jgi:hypothetical protein
VLSAWTVVEIVETPDHDERQRLLAFCNSLWLRGKVLGYSGEILHRSIGRMTNQPGMANVWFGPQAEATENMLRHYTEVTDEDRKIAARENGRIRGAFEEGVEDVRRALQTVTVANRTLGEWVASLVDDPVLLERDLAAHGVPPEAVPLAAAAVLCFEPDVLPLRAAMLSSWVAVYNRCIPPELRGKATGQGRDLIHGIYLAGCETFVTADEGQCFLLRGVAEYLRPRPEVLMLEDLDALRQSA